MQGHKDETLSKEKILKKVRAALLQKGSPYTAQPELESDVFQPEEGELEEVFAGNFSANNGRFIYCYNNYHFADEFLAVAEEENWQNVYCIEPKIRELLAGSEFPVLKNKAEISFAVAGITSCDALISRTGSVILSSSGNSSRASSIFPPAHICVAYKNQLFYDLKQYFASIQQQSITDWPSMLTITSGPSRTADIEKTLVLGAHGPKQIFVFYIDEDKPF